MSRYYFDPSGSVMDLSRIVYMKPTSTYEDSDIKVPALTVYFTNKEAITFYNGMETRVMEAFKQYASETDKTLTIPHECASCGKTGRWKADTLTCPGCGSPWAVTDGRG